MIGLLTHVIGNFTSRLEGRMIHISTFTSQSLLIWRKLRLNMIIYRPLFILIVEKKEVFQLLFLFQTFKVNVNEFYLLNNRQHQFISRKWGIFRQSKSCCSLYKQSANNRSNKSLRLSNINESNWTDSFNWKYLLSLRSKDFCWSNRLIKYNSTWSTHQCKKH